MKIITTHFNPDYDALASAIAIKKIYPEAYIVLPGNQEKSMKNFFIQTIIYSLDVKNINEINLDDISTLIIVDTSRKDRIGDFSKIIDKKNLEIIIYDHHFEEDNIITDKKYLKNRGACTTITIEALREKDVDLTSEEATILMMGIYEDTGNLTFNTTTEFDYYAAAYLLKKGANLNTVRDILYHDITIEQISILKQFIDSEEILNIKGINVSITQASSEEYIPEIAVAVHKFKDMKNIPVLISLLRLGNKIYLIGRSSSPEISIKKLAEYFGGGGHDSAASAVIKDKTLIQVYNEITAFLLTTDSLTLSAKDIMTTPVIYIYENDSIAFADEILNRYNINVLPVLNKENRKIVGLITRQIVGKASYHDLKNLPVKEYMEKEFYSVTLSANFEIIKDIILKENQRLLPIIDNGELTGVITRTDILKTIYDIENKNNYVENMPTQKDIKNILKNEIDEKIIDKLKTLGKLAEELGYKVYIVGGFVRDLMLREPNLDIDLVVEGNGIKYAKYLKSKIKEIIKIKTYEKFKTAKIFFNDNIDFDIATARLEYYEKPGSLPIVEKSSLKMDLYRRDFTINTLAIDITGENFGELIDFFGGVRDLKEKKIRIIHNLSFVEDPTRIFRAFRFAARFNFELGKQTESLIKNAKSLKLLHTVSGYRLFHELKAIFEEEKVIEILRELDKYNLIKFIFPKIILNDKFSGLLKNCLEILKWHKFTFPDEEIESWLLFFLCFIHKNKNDEIISICDKLSMSDRETAVIINCIEESNYILKQLIIDKKQNPLKIYNLLNNKHLESILFSAAKITSYKLKQKIIEYLINYRFVKPQINGHDLIDMGLKPSPLFKKILEEIKKEKLLGKLANINDEKDFVKKNFLQNKSS